MNGTSYITLSNLLTQVKNVIDRDFFNKEYLVLAEIGNISKPPNGKHWYFDLIEHDGNDKIILIKGNLWEENKNRILSQFEKLNLEFKSQIKTIFKVNVNYSLQYGLRLNVLDADAVYVLGDLTKRKLETIEKLKTENLYGLNKEILFPILPKRIAVISSDNSSGYRDFIETLKNNTFNFCFEIKLFPSLMQGKEAIESILRSLRSIYQQKDNFDVVVITRGGGSKTDLELFNDFILCNAICKMNLPVITGLGHTPDESVLDMISNQQRNTPTDAAKYLIDKYSLLSNQLNNSRNIIRNRVQDLINENKITLKNYSTNYFIKTQQLLYDTKITLIHYKKSLSEAKNIIENEGVYLRNLNHKFNLNCSNYTNRIKNVVERLRSEISYNSKSYLVKEKVHLSSFINVFKKFPSQKIDIERNELRKEVKLIQTHWNHFIFNKSTQISTINKSLKQLDPINVLRRGYSITLQNGKPITDSKELRENSEIITTLHIGEVKSIIKSKK